MSAQLSLQATDANAPLTVDDFLPASVRDDGLGAAFGDWHGPDGETYRRVALVPVPGFQDALERLMGPVQMLGMGYRLNFGGEMPNAAIHSDLGWGTHAAVVYLSEGEGGTAFWRHKATGASRIDPGDVGLFEKVRHDWNDPDSWEQVGMAAMKLGRGVIYESAQFHSRWPFPAFGEDAETGRLIAVAFFNPEKA